MDGFEHSIITVKPESETGFGFNKSNRPINKNAVKSFKNL